MKRPPPAPLHPELEEPLRAVLCEIEHKCCAAQGALSGGRLGWTRRWCLDTIAAVERLGPALERAIPADPTP